MPDYDGGREAFREAVRVAEEAALAAEQETPSALPEMEGAEPVQASDQPLTLPDAEPAVADTPAEETQTAAEQAAERLLAGKYKTPEELEAAYQELQSAFGRQGQEIGELRTAFEQFSATQATPAPAPVAITPELIDTDPQRATLLAYAQKNEQALHLAFEQWKDIDPFTAGAWLNERRMEQAEQAHRAEMEQLRAELQSVRQPQEAAQQEQEWRAAMNDVAAQHPDFLASAERIISEVAPKYPNIIGPLASGDRKAKAEILTALYAIDRASNTDPAALSQQLQEEAARAAEEARLAREGATVVTQATAGLGSDEPELTPEQKEAQRYLQRFQSRVSLDKGWTGRSGA